jgi:hypothetical protein
VIRPTEHPAVKAAAVTPDDTNANVYRALYVGGSGDLAVVCADDTVAVTFKNVPIGFFPVSVDKVMATNTTATEIIGLI